MKEIADMHFGFAASADEPRIKRLLADSNLHHQDITPRHLSHFLMARDGAQLAGVVGIEIYRDCALLRSLAVESAYRRKGLASALVARIEDYAASLNVDSVYLLTMTAEDFFATRGYQRSARESAPPALQQTTEFQELCPVSAVCMVKRLHREPYGRTSGIQAKDRERTDAR